MISHPEIKYVIAIASGKGGVGKSTTAVNLACALLAEGQRVGILDADLYGPSIPLMLNIHEKYNGELNPVVQYGLQTMSIGYFLEPETPAIWRGPMVSKYLQELFQNTTWKNLNYLIIDLPPGTGDIQLTLSQKIRVTGSIIVTTPQEVALIDAKKAVKMFEKVNVPVFGVIENMSTHTCSHCGHTENIFGEKGAQSLGIEVLGQLPLDIHIREQADNGEPLVYAMPESTIAKIYRDIAKNIIHKINKQQALKSKLPKIEIKGAP